MSATSVADVAAGTVHAAVDIAAPPERVFRALTDPGELAAWWGSPETYKTFDWSIDLRPGGKWSCRARAAGGDEISTVGGEYKAVDPPRLLEYTWLASWEDFAPSTVRIEIAPSPLGSRLTLLHQGRFPSEAAYTGFAEGWKRVLNWMAGHIAPEVSP
jgi:uncharacterized protein YndB with AHSA1/START domain